MEKPKKLSQDFILKNIRKDLEALASPEKKRKEERFFKEKVSFIGCMYGDVGKVARKYFLMLKDDGWTYEDFLEAAEELMKKGTHEETVVGLSLVERMVGEFRESDFDTFGRWLEKYVTNWALCDQISPHIIGEMIGKYPGLAGRVFGWTKSKNRWKRRAAAVTYVIHGHKGRFHERIFKTAEAMIGDADEMVQKGVGWMLKTTSQSDESAVVKFLLRMKMKRKDEVPRLVLRYAAEKMAERNRKLVLK